MAIYIPNCFSPYRPRIPLGALHIFRDRFLIELINRYWILVFRGAEDNEKYTMAAQSSARPSDEEIAFAKLEDFQRNIDGGEPG